MKMLKKKDKAREARAQIEKHRASEDAFNMAFSVALLASKEIFNPTSEQLKELIDLAMATVETIEKNDVTLKELMDEVTKMMEPVAEEIEKEQEAENENAESTESTEEKQ